MKRCVLFTGLGLLLFLYSAAGQSHMDRRSTLDKPYGRAIRGAIERAQAELEGVTDLWEDHSTWENAWEVQSGSYLVRTTHSRRLGLDVGGSLEVMLAEFSNILNPDFKARTPFPVFILPVLSQYNQFGDDFGEHHSSIYGSFFAADHEERPVAVLYDENRTLLLMYATHSALHQFIDRSFSRNPPTWISEGLASYFAIRWAYAWGVSQLQGLIDGNRFIPLAQLRDASLEQYAENAHARFMELGMLFYYLLHFREDTRMTQEREGAFAEYLRAVLGGSNHTQLPFHDLATRRIGELEADFKAFSFPTQ